ncbi:MAG: molybdopterin-synthase adenylyltransferase MoeB [Anaerolineae bacterium]
MTAPSGPGRSSDAERDGNDAPSRDARPSSHAELARDDALSRDEILRYSRHLIMPEVGLDGQRALKQARVLLIGAGGLGSPAALYLAAAGVGTIGIVDGDVVDTTNLQRQVIHSVRDVGRAKVASAADAIQAINPDVDVIRHETLLNSTNALEIVGGYDLVLDGTDNFPTRYLVNDACVLTGRPYAYGSVYRFDGLATVFAYAGGPCYRCLYPVPPPPGTVPSCAEGGVLGVVPGVIGLIQATETIKLILGHGESLTGRLLMYDALGMSFREIKIRRDPSCPVCGDSPTITAPIDYHEFCGVPGHEARPDLFDDQVDPVELKAMMDRGDSLVLIDVREPHEHQINRIPSARLMPLADLPSRLRELDTADEIVAYCLVGTRSADACRFLRDAGFNNVRNLRGGIRAWIDAVDNAQPQY